MGVRRHRKWSMGAGLAAVLAVAVSAGMAGEASASGLTGAGGAQSPAVAVSTTSSGSPMPPSQDPFYSYSGPLAQVAPGTVLRSRTVSVPWASSPVAFTATQLLYRTTDELGQPAVSVTTVLQPVGALPVKLVSWQMFYDALGSQCDPSYTLQGGNPSYGDASQEEDFISPYLAAGDTVVIPDYEGEDLAWGAGQQSGYETLDSVRAAEHALGASPSTTPVAFIGYSGGAIATEWAAETAPAYAPGLDVVGSAGGGVAADFAHNLTYVDGSPSWSGVIPAVLIGVARAFGVDLETYLSDYGKTMIAAESGGCINSFTGAYPGLTMAQLLKPQYQDFLDVPAFASIVNELIMGSDGTPEGQVFLANGNADGTGDGVMVAADVEGLAHEYCTRGVPVTFGEYQKLDHTEAAVPFEASAVPLVSAWLGGVPTPDGCAAVGTGNSLAPLPSGTAPPAPPAGTVTSADVTSVLPSGSGSAIDGFTTLTITGAAAATVSQYRAGADPAGPPPAGDTGRYLDVAVSPGGSALSSVTVQVCHVPSGATIWWWDAASGTWVALPTSPASAGGATCVAAALAGGPGGGAGDLTSPGGAVVTVAGPAPS